MGGLELLIISMVFGLIGLQVWGIVDIARRPEHEWRMVGQEKTLWLLIVLMVGLPGVIAYAAIARPKFEGMRALAGPPGWYPDPMAPGFVRYFDGRTWTQHVAPMGGGALPPGPYGPPR
jgi:hypothetical protein